MQHARSGRYPGSKTSLLFPGYLPLRARELVLFGVLQQRCSGPWYHDPLTNMITNKVQPPAITTLSETSGRRTDVCFCKTFRSLWSHMLGHYADLGGSQPIGAGVSGIVDISVKDRNVSLSQVTRHFLRPRHFTETCLQCVDKSMRVYHSSVAYLRNCSARPKGRKRIRSDSCLVACCCLGITTRSPT